ncbi:MAG: hypothetical protein E7220_00060 [Clostridiales bacterium]|nr:hypothetical protein [Clostridiales bacterium]
MSSGGKHDIRNYDLKEGRNGKLGDKRFTISFPAPLYAFVLVALYAVTAFLFYRQTIRYNGGYKADTSLYVDMSAEKHGVRLITWIYHWLYSLRGDTLYIALYMAAVVVLTVVVNYMVIRWYVSRDGFDGGTKDIARLASVMMLFTGSMYLPVVHERFYKASWCTYAWHSPTQQLMILFAMISLLLFLKIYDNYMKSINPLYWLGLLFASLISVWAKPSFMLVFIPTVIVVFLIELAVNAKDGRTGRRFLRLVLFGLSMVPSGVLILLLNMSIYGEGSKNKVAMQLGGANGFGYNVYAAAFCGLLFPAVVFLFNLRKFKKMPFQIALGMLFFGIAEWAIFHEVGSRGEHGNFGWGRQFGCYYVFVCAIVMTIENYRDKKFLGGKKWARAIYFVVVWALLAVHVLSQMYHFYLMFRGHSYYI